MPILWHSNAPHVATGYGQQTALFAPRLARRGHDVAVSALYGLGGAPTRWNGLNVLPPGTAPGGCDTIAGHAAVHFNGRRGVVIALADAWTLEPGVFGQLPTAVWFPVDADRLSAADKAFIDQARPHVIAMSRHGQRCAERAGYQAFYVPHGIDTAVYHPGVDRAEARTLLDIPASAYVVAINAANKGVPSRKAFAQQFLAFRAFYRKHNDAVLAVHTNATAYDGENLTALARACGIPDNAIRWSNQYLYAAGLFPPGYVAKFYAAADITSNCSMGEGFGLATLESQATGTPVVVTNNSASRELCGAGWKIGGIPFYVEKHQAFWTIPDPGEITDAYNAAYNKAEKMRESAAGFARKYDADLITDEYWRPVLKSIDETEENSA